MSTEQLLKEIEAAFPFVEKPKGLDLSFHNESCFQCSELRSDLEMYCEKNIPNKVIRIIHQELSCLSADGWRWVLPSYLRYCVTREASYNQTETEFLIYNLAPSLEYQNEAIERLSALNAEQRQCLVHFLEWCKRHDHWGQYCPNEISKGIEFLSTI